jgi:hypothetical protein
VPTPEFSPGGHHFQLQFLRLHEEQVNDMLADARFQGVIDTLHNGLRVHLCADVFHQGSDAGNGLVAFGYRHLAKLVGLLSVIGNVDITGFNRLGDVGDFTLDFLQRRQRIGISRNHPGWNAFDIVGIHVEHQKKLTEKLGAVAIGETMKHHPRQFPFFSRI